MAMILSGGWTYSTRSGGEIPLNDKTAILSRGRFYNLTCFEQWDEFQFII